MSSYSPPGASPNHNSPNVLNDEGIDIRDLLQRLARGFGQTLGFALLGLTLAAIGYVVMSPLRTVSISTRVVFAFDGFERGEYPDRSKFQSDDLRAPELIAEALKRLKLDKSGVSQAEIRGSVNIEGVFPADVVKQRDRLRNTGQVPMVYIPDEYIVTMAVPPKFPLTQDQCRLLLNELISAFQEKFQRTYARLPVNFGNVRDALKHADYPDYMLILESEIKNVTDYLDQQIGDAEPQTEKKGQLTERKEHKSGVAKSFRSARTNLSFTDLRKRIDLFRQIQLDRVLGLIRINSLTRDKESALIKLDYTLLTLRALERYALEEERVSKEYLSQTEMRSQSYVMGIKSQVVQQRPETPLLDQGLIDSLLANDSYNSTLREAVKSSREVRRIQAEIANIEQRKKEINGYTDTIHGVDGATIARTVDALFKTLLVNYDELIASIRETEEDYARQQFGNAVRLSDQLVVANTSVVRGMMVSSAVGCFLGAAFGMGLSLLGLYVGPQKRNLG